jgi:Pyruvate/2-oxoacid:ferredoxin oxidoreductase gamma subunit
MLVIIPISVLVIGAIVVMAIKKRKVENKKESISFFDNSHEDLAPEATPEPSVVKAMSVNNQKVTTKPVAKTNTPKKKKNQTK